MFHALSRARNTKQQQFDIEPSSGLAFIITQTHIYFIPRLLDLFICFPLSVLFTVPSALSGCTHPSQICCCYLTLASHQIYCLLSVRAQIDIVYTLFDLRHGPCLVTALIQSMLSVSTLKTHRHTHTHIHTHFLSDLESWRGLFSFSVDP